MQTEQIKILSNDNETLIVGLDGRVDTNNANEVETAINALLAENKYENLILDISNLEYISSVGIRILMKLAKNNPGFKIENATKDVYEILEMTGIPTVIPISKKMREFSVEGLEKIDAGFNGVVYRLDDETIIKVINNPESFDLIQNERDIAQKAFLMGVPTAISFDVVKVGETYGIIYELLNTESYQTRLQNNPDKLYELGKRFGELGREINSINVEDESFDNAKEKLLNRLERVKPKLSETDYESVKEVLNAIPEGEVFVHGDFHPGNVLVQNDEPLLIDMATAAKGHPIIDLMSFALPILGSVYAHPEDDFVSIFNNLTKKQNLKIYDAFLEGYFDTGNEEYLEKIKAQIFPFMLAKKALGMAKFLPKTINTNNINFSEENESKRVANLGLQGLINGLQECLEDMRESFKKLDGPLDF